MEHAHKVLVLGAYGLAGRAIVERLREKTPFQIIATGRDPVRLEALYNALLTQRLQTRVLDATDAAALGDVCREASFVINAVGPFARNGAAIARTVIECGRPYLDCANEQRHYHNLKVLHDLACRKEAPLITAAGAIPGCSTLLTALLLEQAASGTCVECCWAQFRHAYADSGLASMMSGILEALESPSTMHAGELTPVRLGKSMKTVELPAPFGSQRLMELPTIDALTLPRYFQIQDHHTWFYMGDLPLWLLDIIRALQPQRRPWVYRLVEAVMRRINASDTEKAIASGVGPESLLMVTVSDQDKTESRQILFRDGAVATACLPVYLAGKFLRGEINRTGLLTPLDLVQPGELPEALESATVVHPFPE
ncbi:MAG: hypothetical protein GXY07_18240 [Candidatus Hydrogenedentes bacterium]|jgi:short subunit dehydrogenase-like uncharacterized protein|nr:hypothetical protein [Candidatus Hydrogenedentota bacterium]